MGAYRSFSSFSGTSKYVLRSEDKKKKEEEKRWPKKKLIFVQ